MSNEEIIGRENKWTNIEIYNIFSLISIICYKVSIKI